MDKLEVLDGDMAQVADHQGEPLHFGQLISEFDYIIGSDLLYFSESIIPLFEMLDKLFQIRKNANNTSPLIFYMCMMQRGKELPIQLKECISNSNFEAELVEEDHINNLAK